MGTLHCAKEPPAEAGACVRAFAPDLVPHSEELRPGSPGPAPGI